MRLCGAMREVSLENILTDFKKQIKEAVLLNNSTIPKFSNLTNNQTDTLHKLKNSNNFIILPVDKNLGPTIINRSDYIKQALSEHLLMPDYQQLSKEEALYQTENTKKKLLEPLLFHKHSLSQAELNVFNRSFKKHHRIPIFYGMPKVHKSPLKLRPAVSCINSFNAIFSIWLDFRMKQLLHLVPSYIRDSKALLNDMKTIHIPKNAKIFTVYAMAMYTNIDTTTGVTLISNLINTNKEKIPLNFPTELFLLVLESIMNTNIFTFGDTFWHQQNRTAIGTQLTPYIRSYPSDTMKTRQSYTHSVTT